jgi:TDG/mug DNA glycosylase family protein
MTTFRPLELDEDQVAADNVPRVRALMLEYQPGILAFTGKRAAREFVGHPVGYGLLAERIGDTRLFVLPSPSGAARGHWDIEHWRELSRLRAAMAGCWTRLVRDG